MGFRGTLALAVLLGMAAVRPALAEVIDCEPARCAVQDAINANCSCDAATNHGRYVSCVAHQIRQLSIAGLIPTTCKGKVQRCAARSTCGHKTGFVTCRIPTDTCDLLTLTCVGNPALTCATDLDCGSKCSIKSSAERCLTRGGTPGSGTCCASCAP